MGGSDSRSGQIGKETISCPWRLRNHVSGKIYRQDLNHNQRTVIIWGVEWDVGLGLWIATKFEGRYKQIVPVYDLDIWRKGGTIPLLTSALNRGDQPHTLATLLQGKCPKYPLEDGRVRQPVWTNWRRNYLLPVQATEPRFRSHPARSLVTTAYTISAAKEEEGLVTY